MSVGEEILGPLGATETGRLASLEGSLFEALLALLERLRGDMLGRLLDAVMRDVKEKAQPYCKDRYGWEKSKNCCVNRKFKQCLMRIYFLSMFSFRPQEPLNGSLVH